MWHNTPRSVAETFLKFWYFVCLPTTHMQSHTHTYLHMHYVHTQSPTSIRYFRENNRIINKISRWIFKQKIEWHLEFVWFHLHGHLMINYHTNFDPFHLTFFLTNSHRNFLKNCFNWFTAKHFYIETLNTLSKGINSQTKYHSVVRIAKWTDAVHVVLFCGEWLLICFILDEDDLTIPRKMAGNSLEMEWMNIFLMIFFSDLMGLKMDSFRKSEVINKK